MKKILNILVLSFTIFCITGCVDTNNNIEEQNTNLEQEQEEINLLELFVSNFDENNEYKLINKVKYDAQEKSGYYRTEFRLNAFKNNESLHANIINESNTIDIIFYKQTLSNNLRVYIKTAYDDLMKKFFTRAIKSISSEITDDKINEVLSNLDNSSVKDERFNLDNGIDGSIIWNYSNQYWEIMID